jgi:ribosomal protein S6--L-glutamate ligase/gamma-F420-2:alpha-L-glutamate ligase
MKGWLIHNGSLQTDKFKQIHTRYLNQAKKQGIHLTLKRNDEVMVLLSQTHQPLTDLMIDFVLFLDKDVLLAKQLEACGLPVFNSSEAIELCDNKGLMHHSLATKGIRQPKTIIAPLIFETGQTFPTKFLDQVAETLGFPIIVKKSFGSFGEGVYLVKSMTELKQYSETLKSTPHLYQQYIASSHGRDMRVHVVGENVIATMLRQSETDFRANVTNGGKMFVVDVPDTFKHLAIKATNALGLDFSGVDLLFDEANEPIVCEVNSNAHIENIYQATGIDVSEAILTYIISRVHHLNR